MILNDENDDVQGRSQDSSLPKQSTYVATGSSGPIHTRTLLEALNPALCSRCKTDAATARKPSVSGGKKCHSLSVMEEYDYSSERTMSGEEVARERKQGISLIEPEIELGSRNPKRASTRILIEKPESNYCHICSLYAKVPIACKNNKCSNRSRKVICDSCVKKRGWDLERLKRLDDWRCTHCRGVCCNAESPFPHLRPKRF